MDTKLPERWKIVVARNNEEIEGIRSIWERMQRSKSLPTVNADIDRYLSIVQSIKEVVQPYVMVLYYDDNPQAMVIGRIEKRQITCQMGYLTILKPSMRCLSIVYGGILGQPSDEICVILLQEIIHALKQGQADVAFFNQLRIDSSIYKATRTVPSFLLRSSLTKPSVHHRMSIPDDIELFYQERSPKHRKHLRQYVRKLEKSYPGRVKMITYSREDELDDAIRAASQISSKTYQHAMGCGFVDSAETRGLLTTAVRRGWLRAHILYICDEPCAFRFALHYERTYLADGIGFDPKWKRLRVGTILFLKVLETICKEPTIDSYDFGFGDAEYKVSYGNEQWQEASVYIFAPRLYAVFVNILKTCTMALNSGLEYAVDKAGFADRIKRYWRNRLQRKASENKHGSSPVLSDSL